MKLKKVYSVFAAAMALTLALTACGSSNTSTGTQTGTPNQAEAPAPTQNEAVEAEAGYPIVIDHAFGQTILETKPERIATISWGNQDLPLALGVVPVGISEANYGVLDGSGLLPWTKAKFEELGVENPVLFKDTAGLDYEAISDVQPDVILAAYSGLTQEEYDLLSEIAPVVAYPTLPWQTYWRDQIVMDAAGMGMKAEGEALVSDLEDLIAQKTSEYPQIKGKSAAFFYFTEADLGKFYIYLPSDPRVAFLMDLGMVNPESVAKLAAESDSFALELSAENIDLIEDIELVITYGTDTLLEALQKDPLVGTLPAVQRGSVAVITDGTPLAAAGTPSALSIPATIDEYLSIIGKAADQVE
jgi:iron complex transport system substrate-binding protein